MNTKNWIWLVIIIAVLGLLFFIGSEDQPLEEIPENEIEMTDNTQEKEEVSTTKPYEPPVEAPVASLSYNEALTKYKDKRIQLSTNCQAQPNLISLKKGTTILIDNRSSETRVIEAGEETLRIEAYGFELLTLPSEPTTLLLDCNSYQNIATILVQD